MLDRQPGEKAGNEGSKGWGSPFILLGSQRYEVLGLCAVPVHGQERRLSVFLAALHERVCLNYLPMDRFAKGQLESCLPFCCQEKTAVCSN